MTAPSKPPQKPVSGADELPAHESPDSVVPPELRPFIDAERERPNPSAEAVERIRRGVERHLDAGTQTRFSDLGEARPRSWRPVVTHALTFGIGLVAGAMMHAAWTTPAQNPSAVAAPTRNAAPMHSPESVPSASPHHAAPPAPPAPAPTAATEEPQPTAPSVIHHRSSPAPVPSDAGSPSTLERERILVEEARVALREGRAQDALVACRRHAQEFPGGMMLEDRWSLEVRALVASGNTRAARQELHQFETRFPRSLHRRSLRALVPISGPDAAAQVDSPSGP